jgi:hypothetical protein
MAKQWPEIQLWLDYARKYAARVAMARNPHHVSVNDLYEGVMNGRLLPPPDVAIERRGMAMCAVFTVPAFRNTGDTVISVNPVSKSRKLVVFEYMPFAETDSRFLHWTDNPFYRGSDWS